MLCYVILPMFCVLPVCIVVRCVLETIDRFMFNFNVFCHRSRKSVGMGMRMKMEMDKVVVVWKGQKMSRLKILSDIS